ncbi:MAG: acetylornithine deacetylase [Planctomycetota bacterium JB042]
MSGARTTELLRRLVGFDTVSSKSNLALIDFVADLLDARGIGVELTRDDDGTQANLFATVGPADRPGVVLSGHTDVVPVEGQAWSSDPFEVTERDGRLHGRGTADMKGFLAAALAAIGDVDPAGLRSPVHLAFSYGEEVGCVGAPRMIAALERSGRPRPRAVIVGEPTNLSVVHAHKGICTLRTTVHGHAAHSSLPDAGAGAISIAAEIVRFLAGLADEMRRRGGVAAGFDVPCTTLNVGSIEGGTAVNVIPARCRFEWEFRTLPDADAEEIPRRLDEFLRAEILPRERARGFEVRVETERTASAPALVPSPDSPALRLAFELVGEGTPGAVSFVTEAGLFQGAGMPAVVCGPGSIEQAHKPDEFITVAQLAAGERFVRRVIEKAADA